MKRSYFNCSKKLIAKLLVFLLIINTFMFTNALANMAEAAPVINDMNINTTDKEVSVYGTGGTDGNGAGLADKPFRYSIGNTQSEWVRDTNNLSIAETLTSGALSNTQVMNNSLVLGSSSGGIETTSGTGLEGFAYKKTLTIDHTKVDSELTNFPATVYLNSINFDFSKCKPDGSDIRFTDKDLNPLKFERVENTQNSYSIPFMSSNSAPSGMVSAGGYYKDCEPYLAFDSNGLNTGWCSPINSNTYLQYAFPSPVLIKRQGRFACIGYADTGTYPRNVTVTLSASNDGTAFTNITSFDITVTRSGNHASYDFSGKDVSPSTAYKYYRWTFSGFTHQDTYPSQTVQVGTAELEVEGVTPNCFAKYNVLIPKVSNQTDTDFYMWYGNPNAYNTSIEAWQDQTGKQLNYNGNVKIKKELSSNYWIVPDGVNQVEVLVVAGGGAGGRGGASVGGGGGGAGGYIYNPAFSVVPNSKIPVKVGKGGTTRNDNAENSVFSTLVAIKGGYGAYGDGFNGGSGGGSAGSNKTPGTGTVSQGNSGGTGYGNYGWSTCASGGGGGAGASGGNATSSTTPGVGGAGIQNSISGSTVTYAVGGNGAPQSGTVGTNGINGTGNGGSGGGGNDCDGGSGGDGTVIVKYTKDKTVYTVTFNTSGSNTIAEPMGSAFFDGNGDTFTVAGDNCFDMGNSDFTHEINVIPNVDLGSSSAQMVLMSKWGANGYQYLLDYYQGSLRYVENSTYTTYNVDLNKGIEYKIAISKTGTTYRLYINNNKVKEWTGSASLVSGTNLFTIGGKQDGIATVCWNGWILGARITKGLARYTSDVVTQPDKFDVDANTVFCTNFDTIYDQNYVMVQHMGDSIVDATGNANNGTATGTTMVNTDFGKARSFNGTSDNIVTPTPTITNKYTALTMFKTDLINQTNWKQILGGSTSTNNYSLFMAIGGSATASPNKFRFVPDQVGSANIASTTNLNTTDVFVGTGVYNGLTPITKVLLNGISEATSTATSGNVNLPAGLMIGKYYNSADYSFDGTIYESRISSIDRSDVWIKAESLSLKNQLLTINSYPSTGFRESEPYDVSGHINDSRVQWTQTTPTGTSITVESNVSLDGGSSWLGWKACTNGAIIADLDGSKDTSNARLKLRQTLNSSSGAITPSLNSSQITINFSKYEYKIAADPNKEYTVKFEVKDANGSITQDSKKVYTKAQTPQFTVTDKTENSMDLAFSDYNPDYTEYQIMCDSLYVNSSGVLTSVPTWITLDQKKITVIGLNLGTMYQFTAKARNKAGEETDYANLIRTGTTGIPIPSGNAEITGSAINNSVMLSWKEIPNSLSYELEMDGVIKNVGQKITYIHKDLMTGTQHTYRVRGRNRSGFSEWSELIPITTTSNLPLIPANVLAKASDDTVTVYWDPAQDALTYTVEIGEMQFSDVQKNSASLFGLKPRTTYTYKVKAVNLIGESEWTGEGSITTADLDTPQITIKQTDSDQIKIGWDKVKGATSYKIALDADENFKVLSDSDLEQFTTSSSITFTHDNLLAKTPHVYRIKAMCAGGESAWSDAVTLETLPPRPAVPTNFRGNTSNNFITLMWDAVQDVIGYDIEVDGIVVENKDQTQYQYKGLDQYTEHTYRVRSVNKEIQSNWSDTLKVWTSGGVPDEPKNVVINNSRGIATLTWDKTPGAQKYDVEVDGKLFSISDNTFVNRNIALIDNSSTIYKETKYRIRAINDLGASEWTGYYINNAIVGQIEKGKELELALTASNIMDFSKYTMNVTYNEKALTVTDLCAYSVEKELAPGMVAGRDIEIVSFTPGHIVFRVNKIIDEGYLYTSIINNIRFTGNVTGGNTLTYTVQCGKD